MAIKRRLIYMLSPRDPLQLQRLIQTEMRGWKKVFHVNGNQKKARIAYVYQTKEILKQSYKRKREMLRNDQRINLRRKQNNCKYI